MVTAAYTHAKLANQLALVWLLSGLISCAQTSQTSSGSQKKLRVVVGEIQEVSLPNRGDGTSELIGTSDNQEIVEVSRRQLAPAVDTLNRNNNGPVVFQIKGITVGTANVVFATKPLNQTGGGQPIRTYVVQVSAK